MQGAGIISSNYSFSGYAPGVLVDLKNTLIHESVGHGFGLLADEYMDGWVSEEIPESRKNRLKLDQAKGLALNVSLTDDPKSVYWSHLIGHPRYPYVSLYEGGYYYGKGVWRSEYESIMRSHQDYLYFNAISRELLVKRILELSGEGYSFEKFLQKDSDEGRPVRNSLTLRSFRMNPTGWVHHPPILIDEFNRE